jgi:glycine oxidase
VATTATDVVIVGGGVMGLSSAWALSRHGLTVTVVDAGPLDGQASGAAAGILGPLAESPEDGPLTALLWASFQRYPGWIAALRDDATTDPEWELSGILRVADATGRDTLYRSLAWRRRYDPAISWQEPAVGQTWAGAVWSPHEGQLFVPSYLRALEEAARRRGVTFALGRPVQALITEGDRCIGVDLGTERLFAATTVVVAGAWSGRLLGCPEWIYPVRGQVLALTAQPRPFPYVRFGLGGYVAPKANGLVVVGATEDRSGFDSRVTIEGLQTLTARLAALAPELLSAPFTRAWGGLRPATADGLPVLGRWPSLAQLVVATGHYRNGILLAPITAEAVVAWVVGSDPDPALPWNAFTPSRIPDSRAATESPGCA